MYFVIWGRDFLYPPAHGTPLGGSFILLLLFLQGNVWYIGLRILVLYRLSLLPRTESVSPILMLLSFERFLIRSMILQHYILG